MPPAPDAVRAFYKTIIQSLRYLAREFIHGRDGEAIRLLYSLNAKLHTIDPIQIRYDVSIHGYSQPHLFICGCIYCWWC